MKLQPAKCRRTVLPLTMAWLLASGHTTAQAADTSMTSLAAPAALEFNIPPQPLRGALAAYAKQAKAVLQLGQAHLQGPASAGVRGRYTPLAALEQLLAHSGVGYRYRRDGQQLRVELYNLSAHDQTRGASLATVYVRGEAPHDWIYHDPAAVSVLTREQMDQAPARHAADLLTTLPGVSSAVNRLDPGLSVNIRGMQDFGRVNTMIDGMRQDFVQSGHQQRNGEIYLDPELLSTVVVHRGPDTGINGATAIAGWADFRTLDFDDLLHGDQPYALRLRGMAGPGGIGNHANFVGSVAGAFRLGSHLEVMAAHARHDLGDYRIGRHKASSLGQLAAIDPNTGGRFQNIKSSAQQESSNLFKAKLTLPNQQYLQFGYVGTQIHYSNTTPGYYDSVDYRPELPKPSVSSPWKKLGDAAARTNSYSLDYGWKPDNNRWIDLKAKLYWVTTQVYTNNDPRYPDDIYLGQGKYLTHPEAIKRYLDQNFWDTRYTSTPLCENSSVLASMPGSFSAMCNYGINLRESVRTQTPGLKLENTSRFELGHETLLTANYGAEYYQDRGHSSSLRYHEGKPHIMPGDSLTDGLNPAGRRTIASVFGSLQLQDDFYTVKAGLRYDHYWIHGDTQLSTNNISYYSTAENMLGPQMTETAARAYFQHYVDQWNKAYPNQYDNGEGKHCNVMSNSAKCLATTGYGPSDYDHQYWNTINEVAPAAANDPGVIQEQGVNGKPVAGQYMLGNGYSIYPSSYGPTVWSEMGGSQTYRLRRNQDKYLPFFSVAIRPTSWLELYGDWAKSWRPPALDETLISGAHAGSIGALILPNPFLKPETSRTWEIGSNMNFHNLFTTDDQLHLKMAYADTVVDNYVYTSLAFNRRDDVAMQPILGDLGFVNNQHAMRFRDLELESDYDAGWTYGRLSYTHYLGGQNKFCQRIWPQGVAPNPVQDLYGHAAIHGISHAQWADLFSPDTRMIGAQGFPHPGYATWTQWAQHANTCGNFAYNSALALPVDKGSVTLGVRMFQRRLDTGLRFNYSGRGKDAREYGSPDNNPGIHINWAAYHVLDWYASYRWRSWLKLTASMQNLLDRQYVDGSGDALARTFAPGRTLQMGVQIDI